MGLLNWIVAGIGLEVGREVAREGMDKARDAMDAPAPPPSPAAKRAATRTAKREAKRTARAEKVRVNAQAKARTQDAKALEDDLARLKKRVKEEQ